MRLQHLSLTTDPGLEDVALDELRELAGPTVAGVLRPDGRAGHLRVEGEGDLLGSALRMRSIHHIVRPIAEFAVPDAEPLRAIRSAIAEIAPAIPEFGPVEATFRVTCARSGDHPFTSEQVEREAGAGVRDALPRAVRLKGMDVEVRCDVRGDRAQVGVQLTGRSLSRRPGVYRPHTSLRANVAWAMLALAHLDAPPTRLLDPFVGAGTILSEAAARWPQVGLFGSDREARTATGARQNLGDRAEIREGDARRLGQVWPDHTFDLLVTNPPFGHRLAGDADLGSLYRAFLEGAADRAEPGARLVVLAQRRGDFNRALRAVDRWETRHVRMIELGGLYVGLFVLALR